MTSIKRSCFVFFLIFVLMFNSIVFAAEEGNAEGGNIETISDSINLEQDNSNIILNIRDLDPSTEYSVRVISDDQIYDFGNLVSTDEGMIDAQITEYNNYIIVILNDIIRFMGINESEVAEKLVDFGILERKENVDLKEIESELNTEGDVESETSFERLGDFYNLVETESEETEAEIQETVVETEIETEVETETEVPTFDYESKGIILSQESLEAEASTKSLKDNLRITVDIENKGNIDADAIDSVITIDFPEGVNLEGAAVEDNNVVIDGKTVVIPGFENTNITDVSVNENNSMEVSLHVEKTEEVSAVEGSSVMLLGSNISVDVKEPVYQILEDDKEEKVFDETKEVFDTVEEAQEELEELLEQKVSEGEIERNSGEDSDGEDSDDEFGKILEIVDTVIPENSFVNISANSTVIGETELVLDEVDIDIPINSLKSYKDLQGIIDQYKLGQDLGLIDLIHSTTSVEKGSGFEEGYRVRSSPPGQNNVWQKNSSERSSVYVTYKNAAMYQGKLYDVKIYYWSDGQGYSVNVSTDGRGRGAVTNMLNCTMYKNQDGSGDTIDHYTATTNYSSPLNVHMHIVVEGAPADSQWLFAVLDCDKDEGWGFSGSNYFYNSAGNPRFQNLGRFDSKSLSSLGAENPGDTYTVMVSNYQVGDGSGNNGPNFYAITQGNNCYGTYTSKGKYRISEIQSLDPSNYGTLNIRKKIEGTNDLTFSLAGFEFLVESQTLEADSPPVKLTLFTDESGKTTAGIIPAGTYIVKEVSTPDNTFYDFLPDQTVTVTNNAVTTVTYTNKYKRGSVSVHKVIDNPAYSTWGQFNQSLAGWTFELAGTAESGEQVNVTAVTDASGTATFNDIPVGKNYLITETGAPPNVSWDCWIRADDKVIAVNYNKTTNVTMKNSYKVGSLHVKKTITNPAYDRYNPLFYKSVAGWVFRLTGTSFGGDSINITATTNADGVAVFENVPVGVGYTISEVSEPGRGDISPGWVVAPNKTVNIEYQHVTNAEMHNIYKTGKAEVNKFLSDPSGYHLTNPQAWRKDGFKFWLRGTSDGGDNVNLSMITNSDGYAVLYDVPIGTYTVTEDLTVVIDNNAPHTMSETWRDITGAQTLRVVY